MSWQETIERTVTGLGYELVDVERGQRGLLRVSIDKAGGQPAGSEFITVDDCERVTRQLQHVLEVEGCAYERLEVSSPGLDRPLKRPADYARFVGEEVARSVKLPLAGRKKYQGVLSAGADAGGWRLVFSAAAGTGEHVLDFSIDEVREARLVPVLDFKGRRFAAPAPAGDEVDGDRKP